MNTRLTPQQIATYTLATLTYVLTEVGALVPTWSQATQDVIQGSGTVLAAAVAIAGAVHHLASVKNDKVAVAQFEQSVEDKLRSQISAAGMTPNA